MTSRSTQDTQREQHDGPGSWLLVMIGRVIG
jgi:hypothetical protein